MNRDEFYTILKEVAFGVIEDEGLSTKGKIRFKKTVGGTRRKSGDCIKLNNVDGYDYAINIHTTTARFFEDINGRFKDNKGGRWRKAAVGKLRCLNEIIDTLAHEIAHLKFWAHNVQHTGYTVRIFTLLKNKLVERGVDVEQIE